MPIDRTRFLLLTAALSAVACGKAHKSHDDVTATPDNDPNSGTAVDQAAAALKSGSSSGNAPGAGHAGSGGATTAHADGGSATSGGGGGGTGGACTDNSSGSPGDCSALKAPGPSCESFSDTKASCSTFKRALKPRVAEKAVGCLLSASNTKAICDFNKPSACFASAIAQGCIDPATTAQCAPVVSKCGGRLSAATCEKLLSAVTSKHTQQMVACMTEGCDVSFCFDGLAN